MATKNAATTVLVPFHREKTGHITVVARLSGKTARFVVDTGAGGTCIHAGYLEKYKLGLTTKTKKGGGIGSSTMSMTRVAVHDLSIETVDLKAFKLIALDLSHVIIGLAKAKVEGLVGVIGADVLHRNHAVIDYSRGIILFGPSSFRVEPHSQNRWSSSSPVGMWAGCL